MQEQRLFHRYPSGLKVGFRIRSTGYRGYLVNVSVGGGYISTHARPSLGSRVQMAARRGKGTNSVWLDMRVAWTVDSTPEEGVEAGFGGYWLHASSRKSESELREFLEEVLGITRAVIRPMTPPTGGDTVYLYKFADVYSSGVLGDLPWMKPAAERPRYVPTNAAPESEAVADVLSSAEGDPTVDDMLARESEAASSFFGDNVPADQSPWRSEPIERSVKPPPAGRWDFIMKRLSRVGKRGAETYPGLAHIEVSNVKTEYRLGNRAYPADFQRCGEDWVVFRPSDRLPEVWSRIVLSLTYSAEADAPRTEIHVTVTRLKETSGGHLVHCKVSQVDEPQNPGAYSMFVKRFNR